MQEHSPSHSDNNPNMSFGESILMLGANSGEGDGLLSRLEMLLEKTRVEYAIIRMVIHNDNARDILRAKIAFEMHLRTYGVIVMDYHSDNGVFNSRLLQQHLQAGQQTITLSGVGAQHQDGLAERHIGIIIAMARTMLLHAITRWSAISLSLWPFAVEYASKIFNMLPKQDGTIGFRVYVRQRFSSLVWRCWVVFLVSSSCNIIFTTMVSILTKLFVLLWSYSLIIEGFHTTTKVLSIKPLYAQEQGTEGIDIVARRILVKGDVNGGYVRTCILNEAGRFRKLIGTMSPPGDGDTAEIYVEGTARNVDGFIRWCKKGNKTIGLSQTLNVIEIIEEEPTGLYDGFYVKTGV